MFYNIVLNLVVGYLDVRYTLLHIIYVIFFLHFILDSTCSVVVACPDGMLMALPVGKLSGSAT